MPESKVFRITEGIDASSIGKEVENFLRNEKKLTTEGIKTPDGYFVQAKEQQEVSWKKLAGMTIAIQIQIIEVNDTVTVNIGNGEWSDKIGAGIAGAVLFAPLAVTAAIGAFNLKKLPNQIFDHIEKFILSGGQSVVVSSFGALGANENEILCPKCNTINNKEVAFCGECGEPLTLNCPNCGAHVPLDTKFCNQCGSPLKQEKTCPSCGAVVNGDMKFCGECGTKME